MTKQEIEKRLDGLEAKVKELEAKVKELEAENREQRHYKLIGRAIF